MCKKGNNIILNAKENTMQSVREVTRLYKEMLNYDHREGGINCYRCQHPKCGFIAKYEYLDKGTTPMFHTCPECNSRSVSTMGNDIAPDKEPDFEWYRPSLKQTLKLRKPSKQGSLDHVLLGGLLWRKKTAHEKA